MTQTHQLALVASELESMRCFPTHHHGIDFPPACRAMLYSLPQNMSCMDCGAPGRHQWASISFGALICLQCSGKHRSYGVKTSFVRSVDMDTWTHKQVLSMLEGGNGQLQQFFDRHRMRRNSGNRYYTKAAQFYRLHLANHALNLVEGGVYMGREASRNRECSFRNQRETDDNEPLKQQNRHSLGVSSNMTKTKPQLSIVAQ